MNKKNLRRKGEKGITLVALIITIIILLILAGVAISAVSGNGIIAHAKSAKKNYSIAQEEEELSLNVLDWKLNNQNKEQTLMDFLGEKYGESNVRLNTDKSITVIFESGRKYKVNENGEVTLLDGTIEEPTPVEPKVSLDKKQISESIETGKTKTINLTATLENVTGELTWISSNTDVAEISGDGNTRTITLKPKGTATITVSYGEYKDTCIITVTEIEKAEMIKFSLTNNNKTTEYSVENGMTWQDAFDAGYFIDEEGTNSWYELYGTEEKQYSTDKNTYWYSNIFYTNEYIVTDAKVYNILVEADRLYTGGTIYYTKDKTIYNKLSYPSWYYIIPEGADKSSSSQVKPNDKITPNGKYVVYNDD